MADSLAILQANTRIVELQTKVINGKTLTPDEEKELADLKAFVAGGSPKK